jgi:hypothetical protein
MGPGTKKTIAVIPRNTIANTVVGGIGSCVAVRGAVKATAKNAMAHSGIASPRWNINAISPAWRNSRDESE